MRFISAGKSNSLNAYVQSAWTDRKKDPPYKKGGKDDLGVKKILWNEERKGLPVAWLPNVAGAQWSPQMELFKNRGRPTDQCQQMSFLAR